MFNTQSINLSSFSEEQIDLASRGYIRSKIINSFQQDLLKIKVIKRQLSRYSNSSKINLRLFLNNLILFFNCFDTSIGKSLLYDFIKEDKERSVIKTALIKLNLMTEDEWFSIPKDKFILKELNLLLL